MNLLTKEELEAFRQDYQEKEKEIQRYIGVYLSGLVLVTGWIIGPQSAALLKMVLGNGGYNIYAVLIIVSLNVLFTCFLIYKSLIVHEITQFMTYQSAPETGFKYWEMWRRSPYSATKLARPIYSVLLGVLPIAVSLLLMYGLWRLFRTEPQWLIEQLAVIESNANAAASPNTETILPKMIPDQNQLRTVLATAQIWYWIVAGFHILPLFFFFLNWIPNDRRWAKILALKGPKSSFDKLVANPTLPSSANEEVKLYDKETDRYIDTITQADLKFLIDNLEEESAADKDYYLTKDTLGVLRKAGASSTLIKILNTALGRKSGIEIRWSAEKRSE